MSDEQRTNLSEARAIRAKMTPGPWTVDESSERDGDDLLYRDLSIPEIQRSLHNDEWADVKDWPRDRANAAGIVYCVNTYDALLGEVEALRAERREREAKLAELEREMQHQLYMTGQFSSQRDEKHRAAWGAEAKLARVRELRDSMREEEASLHHPEVTVRVLQAVKAKLDEALADKGPHDE